MRNRRALVATVLLSMSSGVCIAEGNSVASLLGGFANWKIVEIEARDAEKRNLPDSLQIVGTSNAAGISVELICLTRNVDPTVRPFGFELFRGGADTAERFALTIATRRGSIQLQMLTLPEDHSSAIRLSSDTFERVLGLFSEEEDVDVTFETKSGRSIVARVRGSGKLLSIRRSCDQMTS